MPIKKALFYLAVIIVIVYGQFFMNSGLVTGTPPMLPADTIQGEPIAGQIAAGPAVIYFWADWCGICRSMQDTVTQILNEYPGVTVAVRSGDGEEILAHQQQQGLAWQTIADEDGSIGSRFGIKGVPTFFILDKQGRVKFTSVGYASGTGLRLKLWLAGL